MISFPTIIRISNLSGNRAKASNLSENRAKASKFSSTRARTALPLKFKVKNEAAFNQQVNSLSTRGATAFYAGVLQGTQLLSNASAAKWLVALTDGGDNRGPLSAIDDAVRIMERTPRLNFALITVGPLSDNAFAKYTAAVQKNGSKGMIVPASDAQSITKAFEIIESAMITAGASNG